MSRPSAPKRTEQQHAARREPVEVGKKRKTGKGDDFRLDRDARLRSAPTHSCAETWLRF